MSKWFRSEPMEYISLIVNEDAAHDCLADLGKLGVLQFTDVSRAARLSCRSSMHHIIAKYSVPSTNDTSHILTNIITVIICFHS